MAQGKKSFIAYSDWKDTFDSLPDEVAGKLIKHIFAYVNDENPISDDYAITAVFSNIKNTLKRDLEKWEAQLQQRSEAGKKSAEQRASTKLNERSNSLNETVRNSTVSVSVIDSVSDKDIYKSFLHLSLSRKEFLEINKIYSKEQIDFALLGIENTKNVKSYNSLDYAVRFWLKDRPKESIKAKKPPLL